MPTRRHGEDSSKFVNESRIVTLLPSDGARAASPRNKARQGCSQVATATVRPSDGAIKASPTFGERESRVKPTTFPFGCSSVGALKPVPQRASGVGGSGWLFPVDSLSESTG